MTPGANEHRAVREGTADGPGRLSRERALTVSAKPWAGRVAINEPGEAGSPPRPLSSVTTL